MTPKSLCWLEPQSDILAHDSYQNLITFPESGVTNRNISRQIASFSRQIASFASTNGNILHNIDGFLPWNDAQRTPFESIRPSKCEQLFQPDMLAAGQDRFHRPCFEKKDTCRWSLGVQLKNAVLGEHGFQVISINWKHLESCGCLSRRENSSTYRAPE